MKLRVYVDTSVVGGYFDDEFSEDTKPFFDRINRGEVIIVLSSLLEAELARAPKFVRDLFESLQEECIERIEITEEARKLADTYIEAKVVGKTSKADCQHIAMATIAKVDVLVSWNFKHIVNLDKIRGYNGINYQQGYAMIEIRTPKEIINYGEE